MIDAGTPSTDGMCVYRECPSHRGLSWSHHLRSRATHKRAERRARAEWENSSDPMREAGATSTEVVVAVSCARRTGGAHGLTTGAPAQRSKNAERRPRQMRWKERGQ